MNDNLLIKLVANYWTRMSKKDEWRKEIEENFYFFVINKAKFLKVKTTKVRDY